MLVALALFLLGSMASGQAHTMVQLIAFRAVQGIGAGGMQPIALTIVGDVFKIEERARMQGILGAVWAVAGLVGPLLGGAIVATLSWRWIFYVNVPFGIASAALLALGLGENIERRDHSLDLAGAVLLGAAVVALLLGPDVEPWVLLPASVACLVAFFLVERRAKEPIVPLDLFRQRILATSSALSAASGAAMIGTLTFVPLYAQGVLGASPTEAGSTIAAMAVTWPFAATLSGRLMTRFGFRALVRVGFVLVMLSASTMAWTMRDGHASLWTLRLASAAFGIGMGTANTPLVIAVQTSVSFAQRGVATASTMFFRNIGGTVAVGVMGAVLADTLLGGAAKKAGGGELVGRILGPERRAIDSAVLASIAGDLGRGLDRVMVIVAFLALLAACVAFLFPKDSTLES